MEYLLTFIEGIISFISPCMLPLLPLYISYFAAGNEKKNNVLVKSLFFVYIIRSDNKNNVKPALRPKK